MRMTSNETAFWAKRIRNVAKRIEAQQYNIAEMDLNDLRDDFSRTLAAMRKQAAEEDRTNRKKTFEPSWF